MTEEQAKKQIPNFEAFKSEMCQACTANDWYCPSLCNELIKASKMDFNRIIKVYARHDGDLVKVNNYIRQTKINRKRGGY